MNYSMLLNGVIIYHLSTDVKMMAFEVALRVDCRFRVYKSLWIIFLFYWMNFDYVFQYIYWLRIGQKDDDAFIVNLCLCLCMYVYVFLSCCVLLFRKKLCCIDFTDLLAFLKK